MAGELASRGHGAGDPEAPLTHPTSTQEPSSLPRGIHACEQQRGCGETGGGDQPPQKGQAFRVQPRALPNGIHLKHTARDANDRRSENAIAPGQHGPGEHAGCSKHHGDHAPTRPHRQMHPPISTGERLHFALTDGLTGILSTPFHELRRCQVIEHRPSSHTHGEQQFEGSQNKLVGHVQPMRTQASATAAESPCIQTNSRGSLSLLSSNMYLVVSQPASASQPHR